MDKTNIANLPNQARINETARIAIEGMTCDKCVEKVERALRGLRGVREVAVDRKEGVATVTFDNSLVDVPAMHDALLKSGYTPVPQAR
jgi:copper chaperone CopZ